MELAHADLWEFLEAPFSYEPPASDQKHKDLSLIMACCLVIRSLDERPRRMEAEAFSAYEEIREALGKMDAAGCALGAKTLMRVLSGMNYKLVPTPLLVLKTLTWSLVDSGIIGVPSKIKKEDADKEIEAARKALELVASELCMKFGVPHKVEPN